jgi:hypothetical protein
MEDEGKALVSRLMGILAGNTPIPQGVDIIAQNVVAHMDGIKFHGINTWANWIRFIRTRGDLDGLELVVDRLVTNDDGTITAFGNWKAHKNGEEIVSNELWARYRIRNGRIVEIWTTRTNYVFMLGPIMSSRTGQLMYMVHMYFWGRDSRRLDLRLAPEAATSTQTATAEA